MSETTVRTKRAPDAHEHTDDTRFCNAYITGIGSLGLVCASLPAGEPGIVDYLVVCRTPNGYRVFIMTPDQTPRKSGCGNTPENALWMIA